MNEALLTLNAGSSSIKFALFARQSPLSTSPEVSGQIDGIGAEARFQATDHAAGIDEHQTLNLPATGRHAAAVRFLVEWIHAHESNWRIVVVGHRVVHGSTRYTQPVLVDDEVLAELVSYTPLAPLHQPHNVAGIEAMKRELRDVPQVACFDTAFHRTQPEVAQWYALPKKWHDEGVRKYGFHGLSYEYIAEVLPAYLGARAQGKVIVGHLGNGASLCAMEGLESQACTMGFSTLEGLMMGTRPGNLDPGVLLHLMEYHQFDAAALEKMLYRESGLLGVSGISQDMRVLLESPAPEAALAVNLFCHRLVAEIGALAATLGGLDALIFTGGIGEHAYVIRERVAQSLGWLGLNLDSDQNRTVSSGLISAPDSKIAALIIPTNEEWIIARHCVNYLKVIS